MSPSSPLKPMQHALSPIFSTHRADVSHVTLVDIISLPSTEISGLVNPSALIGQKNLTMLHATVPSVRIKTVATQINGSDHWFVKLQCLTTRSRVQYVDFCLHSFKRANTRIADVLSSVWTRRHWQAHSQEEPLSCAGMRTSSVQG